MIASRIVIGVLAGVIIAAGVAAFSVAWRPAIATIDPVQAAGFDPALVKRGRQLAAMGNCNDCHATRGGKPFAGGLPVPTPFGKIYSANITPDPDTGIGRWSEAAFRRAMQSGVDRAGQHLYPTFPYDHFTNVSTDDNRALYAYLMTRPPVRTDLLTNELPFPLNQRPVIAGWKLLFLRSATFKPDPTQSAEWNRGAYLVDGLAHCGSCHTPRNALGAERASAQFAGGVVEDWQAYPLNDQSKSPVPWTADALFTYLRTGSHPAHGLARGPMAQVVDNLSMVSESDVRAIATYMVMVSGEPTSDRRRRGDLAVAQAESKNAPQADKGVAAKSAHPAGAAIYQAACAGCHDVGRPVPFGGVNLHLSTGISASDARNVTNTILIGLRPVEGARSAIMPGFASGMTDNQIVALLTYMRDRFSDQPAWTDLESIVRVARGAQIVDAQTTGTASNASAEQSSKGKP